MRIRLGIPKGLPRPAMKEAIDAALESMTAAQVPLIERGKVPDFRRVLRAGRVQWKPEPPGDEHFDLATTVMGRGWGDCDDLAPWYAASLRASGEDEEARAIVRPSGKHKWHAVVEREDGDIEDPSAAAGMHEYKRRHQVNGDRVIVGASPAAWAPMWDGRMSIAVHPYGDRWAARVDVPDEVGDWSWSGIRTGRDRCAAVKHCIRGLRRIAGDHIDDVLDLRLAALQDLLCGASPREVLAGLEWELDELGEDPDDAVGFFPALIPLATTLAPMLMKGMSGGGGGLPGLGGGLPGIPGMGGGASPGMPPGMSPSAALGHPPAGAGAPGATMSLPGGPVIVKF